jgi:hypothetical protein
MKSTLPFSEMIRQLIIFRTVCFAGSESTTEQVPVSSVVLASKSEVFLKMFSNGTLESEKNRPITIKLSSHGKESLEMLRKMKHSESLEWQAMGG